MTRATKRNVGEDRIAHRHEVDAIVGAWIADKTLEENMEIFEREKVTVAPVYDIEQIYNDEHFIDREIIVELPDDDLDHVAHHGVFPRLSGTPGGFRSPAPSLGQHNEEILGVLGLDDAALEELKDSNVI